MIVSTHQPYFAPYPGFFYKAWRSDILVILDRVQFPRGTTWLTRNRFKSDKGVLSLTIPVWKKGLGLQRIDEVRICHDFPFARKHLASLKTAYARAPFFPDHLDFVVRLFSERDESLLGMNMKIIRYLMQQLHIHTEVVLLSHLGLEGQGERLLIQLCKRMKASVFLAQNAAQKYLNEESFRREGTETVFFRPPSWVYPQLWGSFIPNLSAFDLLFNCGPKAGDILIGS